MKHLWRAAIAIAALAISVFAAQAGAQDRPATLREQTYDLRPYQAPPLGACIATSSLDSSSAFLLGFWQMSSSGLNVTRSTANLPAGVSDPAFGAALSGAIGTWEATQLPNTAFGSISTTGAQARQRFDGLNEVGFGNIGNAVGSTRFFINTSTGNVVEFDTLLNVKYPWSTSITGDPDTGGSPAGCAGTAGAFDVQAVLTHELGHPVGLEHFNNDVQTMYPFVGTGETRKRTLGKGDAAGAKAKY